MLKQKLQETIDTWKWCIIYCRVSSDRQVHEGNGLNSQEKRCRDYAKSKGYIVVKVFYDEGVSGGLFTRPAMRELIAYLDANQYKRYVVLFDDMSRFARDVEVHIQLKTELVARGAKLECLNFNIDDSPESEYAELVLAAGNQYQRKYNRRQVIQKMKARLDDGFWAFGPPPALINSKHPVYGRLLTAHEPLSSIYKELIESYEKGMINTLEEGRDFLDKKYKDSNINRKTSLNGVKNILTEILYTGWLEYKPWGVPLKKAKHEGFISIDTYHNVQKKLLGKAKAPLRKDYSIDFPLRNFVLCNDCKKAITASWHTGRSQRYPHYFCKQKGCPLYNKTIQKALIEEHFENLLYGITPNEEVIEFAKAVLLDIWANRDVLEQDSNTRSQKLITELESQKKQLLQRAAKATSEEIAKEYETEAVKIIEQINSLKESLPKRIYYEENFGTACDIVLPKIEEPILMWKSPNPKDQRLLLEMYFEEKIPYDINEGFGTASLACLPNLLAVKLEDKNQLVEMPGVEPGSAKAS